MDAEQRRRYYSGRSNASTAARRENNQGRPAAVCRPERSPDQPAPTSPPRYPPTVFRHKTRYEPQTPASTSPSISTPALQVTERTNVTPPQAGGREARLSRTRFLRSVLTTAPCVLFLLLAPFLTAIAPGIPVAVKDGGSLLISDRMSAAGVPGTLQTFLSTGLVSIGQVPSALMSWPARALSLATAPASRLSSFFAPEELRTFRPDSIAHALRVTTQLLPHLQGDFPRKCNVTNPIAIAYDQGTRFNAVIGELLKDEIRESLHSAKLHVRSAVSLAHDQQHHLSRGEACLRAYIEQAESRRLDLDEDYRKWYEQERFPVLLVTEWAFRLARGAAWGESKRRSEFVNGHIWSYRGVQDVLEKLKQCEAILITSETLYAGLADELEKLSEGLDAGRLEGIEQAVVFYATAALLDDTTAKHSVGIFVRSWRSVYRKDIAR